MSYTRNCKKCGQRISMRQMSDGHWVAFDVGTQQPHKHGQQRKPDKDIIREHKKKSREKNKKEDYQSTETGEFTDVEYSDQDFKESKETQKTQTEEEFTSAKYTNKEAKEETDDGWKTSETEITSSLKEAIKKNNVVEMFYTRTRDNKETHRRICPLEIRKRRSRKYGDSKYLEAYCRLRRSNRVFALKAIDKMRVLDQTFENVYDIIGSHLEKGLIESIEKEKVQAEEPEVEVEEKEETKKEPPKEFGGWPIGIIVFCLFIFLVRTCNNEDSSSSSKKKYSPPKQEYTAPPPRAPVWTTPTQAQLNQTSQTIIYDYSAKNYKFTIKNTLSCDLKIAEIQIKNDKFVSTYNYRDQTQIVKKYNSKTFLLKPSKNFIGGNAKNKNYSAWIDDC